MAKQTHNFRGATSPFGRQVGTLLSICSGYPFERIQVMGSLSDEVQIVPLGDLPAKANCFVLWRSENVFCADNHGPVPRLLEYHIEQVPHDKNSHTDNADKDGYEPCRKYLT